MTWHDVIQTQIQKFKQSTKTVVNFYCFTKSSMAYSRFGRRSYGRKPFNKFSRRGTRYGRKGAWYNRNNSAAKQMAGFQNVQITHIESITHTLPLGDPLTTPLTSFFHALNIAEVISDSNMHEQLSNVYDQFRIRKVTMKLTPLVTSQVGNDTNAIYYTLFTVIDRNGFAAGDEISLETLQTYQSYKQTAYSTAASNKAPTHWLSYYNSSMFEKSRWYNTKKRATDAFVMCGTYSRTNTAARTVEYQVEFTFDVTYRGLRMDLSEISTTLDLPQ